MENKETNLENTITESMIEAQSTPKTTRVKELSLDDLYNFMRTMNSSINVKVDVQNSKFDEQNSKFDEMNTQNVKFEINMNKHLNEIDTHLNTVKEQILESISSSCEKKIDEMYKNLEGNLNQIMNKKLGDNVIVKTNINNDKIVEDVVLDSKVLNSDDNDVNYNSESIVGVKNNGCLLYTSRCV